MSVIVMPAVGFVRMKVMVVTSAVRRCQTRCRDHAQHHHRYGAAQPARPGMGQQMCCRHMDQHAGGKAEQSGYQRR